MQLSLVLAPDPIFRKKAEPVAAMDGGIRALVDAMLQLLEQEGGIGMAATMVGIPKRIAVVDLREGGDSKPYVFINPEITWKSEDTQVFEEASLCFPGIAANITRPRAIKLRYLDYNGQEQELSASGFLATVIQHELEYMEGRTFLDNLSSVKRDMLLKKMQKFLKHHPPHVHGEHCNH